MLEGEIAILQGVRDVLRRKLSLQDNQCDCEPDEQIPSIASDYYYAVIPAGVAPGPTHNSSGGVHDFVHSVQVLCIARKLEARDKSRIFLDGLANVNDMIANVILAIDWQHDCLSYINHVLETIKKGASPFTGGSVPRMTRIDSKPKPVTAPLYGGQSIGGKGTTPYVGMARSIYFGGMRRIATVTQLGVEDFV
jgi:hypothetical protein